MSGTPAYKKLHLRLREQILSGEYEIGGLLPSENELSREHQINRMTVRQALTALVHEGLIEKQAGRGSVVTSTRKTLGLLSFKGFSEVTGSREMDAATIDLKPANHRLWPSPFFYPLEERELDAGCIELSRLRTVQEHPVMLEYTYIPNLNLPRIEEHLADNRSLFRTLQQVYKVEVETLDQDIQAIAAGEEQADYLQVACGHPLIHIYRKYGTTRSALRIYSSLYCHTAKYTIGNTF